MPNRRSVTRRRFVGCAAATVAAPYVIPATAFGARGSVPQPSNRLTMALIGCGGMGRGDMGALMREPEVQVVAVCDPDKVQRDAALQDVVGYYRSRAPTGAWSGCETYNDFRDVLDRDDVDAVIMATPDHWHALIVVAAARAGKDCYGEKPLSLTIRQGRIMSDAVRRYGTVFQTGSQQRSDGRFRYACELVRNGRIGRVHRAICGLPGGGTTGDHPPKPVPEGFDYNLWLGPAPWAPYCDNRTHWNFRWILDYSGGQVTDWGAHHIDIAHWGLGLTGTGPIEVEGVGEYARQGLWNHATNYRFTATYRTGVQITATNDFENGVKFEGDLGWVFVSRGRIDAEPKSLLTEEIGPGEIHLPRSPGHHRNFLDCVRTRQAPIAPIEQAHRTITVAHLGNIAMQLGRPVRWDPDAEQVIGDAAAASMTDRAMREPWQL